MYYDRLTKSYNGGALQTGLTFDNALRGPDPDDCLCGVGVSPTGSPDAFPSNGLVDPDRLAHNISADYWTQPVHFRFPEPVEKDIQRRAEQAQMGALSYIAPLALVGIGGAVLLWWMK